MSHRLYAYTIKIIFALTAFVCRHIGIVVQVVHFFWVGSQIIKLTKMVKALRIGSKDKFVSGCAYGSSATNTEGAFNLLQLVLGSICFQA